MKKLLPILLLFFASFSAQSQFMQIITSQVTETSNGFNVFLETGTGHGAGFISNSYTITGNVIDLDVCYWFNNTLPILFFTHNFFIPITNPGNYIINIHIKMSQSTEICDNFANPANITVAAGFMSTHDFVSAETVKLFPNPTSGIINFYGLDANVNRVTILDITGKILKTESIFSNNKIDLTSFQDGIYFIQMQTDRGILNKKVIVQY